jgi:hypothetical protein
VKTCAKYGCNYPIFSHLYCRAHQWCRTDEAYQNYKDLKKRGKIPAKGDKRKKDEKRYTEICKELEQEMRSQDPQGRIFCFFSGDEIKGQISWHHLHKRGANLKEKQWLVPSINANHLDYHFLPYEKWSAKPFFNDFMNRLKIKDIETYNKELKRAEKALTPLNPRIFDDDDIF